MIQDQAQDYIEQPRDRSSAEHRIATALMGDIAPIHTVGEEWFMFDGRSWSPFSRAELQPRVLKLLPPDARTAKKANAVLDYVQAASQVPASSMSSFYKADGDAILLNCANGVLRVSARDLILLPSSQDHGFTHAIAADFIETANCPLFLGVIDDALPHADDRELLHLFCGYSLMPTAQFEVSLVCYGRAGTSKSTIAEAVCHALGKPIVARLSLNQLCDNKGYHLPNLATSAINIGTELNSLELDDSSNFKQLVSGETIQARRIYGEPFKMTSTCKLWFLANTLPRFKSGTDAELRRLRFIRFDRVPTHPDVTLKARLQDERNGIFHWMVSGLQRLLSMDRIPLGSAESQKVRELFTISNDPIGAFVAERCDLGPDHLVLKDNILHAYTAFREDHGLAGTADWFYKQLYERYPSIKETRRIQGTTRVRMLQGIRPKEATHED